ncbi:type I glyceraldehyde-3-phosphate dehydrogenase [Candidatus Peregrinibacteria bacterium]|nr:type I glyceraldehyde-3-phosphate dehydrogenase [Candidatus Peregrinibacteria bacterium]
MPNQPRIAINGFGRIGRQVFRVNLEKGSPLNIVAVNNIGDNKTTAHLLKYDSNYGTLETPVTCEDDNSITVGDQKIIYLQEKDPAKLPWKDLNIDIVIECTGIFTDRENASKHLTAGAKKVVISAPGKGVDITLLMGVNQEQYDPAKHHIVSNASCTTNCLAPSVKILNEKLGIEHGLMTTIHSYTNDQRLQDLEHRDLRRARAAAQSIIPTTTGAAVTVAEVIPELKGKLNGHSIRVPTPVVSLTDFTFQSKKDTTAEEVNAILKEASNSSLKGIMSYSDEPLVSVDFKKDPHSSIIDALSTLVMEKRMVKVFAWYDNEWGYSNRTVEMVKLIADKL